MGTVGLSFGSPTSGAGFNVSTTVAEIVGNLQNVETPWKNQLTALQSQDTAISNLGTLLSNLSSDLSQLTDFTGIMAQKTGSSSDTNVLELTNATSSATAGTHNVVVNNLAQSSSGYLAEVTSSAAKLSGSVTIQVGNGTPQTITLNSTDNTLAGLASAINISGAGVTASVLTDTTGSRLSLVSGASGAHGNITITGNTLAAAASATLGYSGTAGTSSTPSTGTLTAVSKAGDVLTGSISIAVGSGSAQTISLGSSGMTLAQLESAINDPTTGVAGVTASVVTNSDGSPSLQLTSSVNGSAATLTVNSSVSDPATHLGYSSTVTGKDASLSVDGVSLTSGSNTVTNLIPGVTFQLLAPSAKESDGSLEQVQVVIGNDNSAVESTVNQMVTDYNSLVSAMNTQEGNTSSGTPEPLFGSPTLSLLQQQLMNLLNQQNPNGYLTPIAVNSSTALTGQVALQVGSGATETFVMGTGTSSGTTIYTGSNTLQGLVDAVNAAAAYTPVSCSSTASDSGSLTASNTANLAGTLNIQTGGGINRTIYLGSSGDAPSGDLATGSATNTLSSLETYINSNSSTLGVAASIVDNGDGASTLSLSSIDTSALTVSSNVVIPGIGVTAGIATNNGQSTLTLRSQTAGSAGAVTVASTLAATGDTLLGFTGIGGGGGVNASGVLDPIPSAGDNLSGSLSIQIGGGTPQTVNVDSSNDTLQGLADTINATAGIGVTASVVPQSDGTALLSLKSLTAGTAGNLTVTSNVLDTTNTTATNMTYNNSSDVSGLANLGITVSQTDNGTLTYDAGVLDSALNSDFSGVLGFFQDANSWGMNFAAMLDGAGTSSSTGILGLAASANSTTESTLNAEVSKEQSYISAQQSSLTTELNSANEILQELPTQLQGINELYAAISGYNQGSNG